MSNFDIQKSKNDCFLLMNVLKINKLHSGIIFTLITMVYIYSKKFIQLRITAMYKNKLCFLFF